MPISCRIFYVEIPTDLKIIYNKLNERILKSKSQLIDGQIYELTAKFFDAELSQNRLVCKLRYQELRYTHDMDMALKPIPDTLEVDLYFIMKSKLYVLIYPRENAQKAVYYLRQALGDKNTRPEIYKYLISKDHMREILKRNPGIVKTCHFKGIDLPGWDSLIIFGDDIAKSQEMKEFIEQHSIYGENYIIWTLNENGWTIGISQGGSAVCWKNLDFNKWAQFVAEKFLK
ncbi:MAG: hypothetical protein QXG08_06395 [Candidatus Methanomethyliaceae archaeon]